MDTNDIVNLFGVSELMEKHREISQRGLEGFPSPTPGDKAGIALVSRTRSTLPEGAIVKLPQSGLLLPIRKELSDELLYYLLVADYEQADMDLLAQAIRKGDRLLDVGGGIGVCAAWMAHLAQSSVVVIEARDDLAPYISETLRINELEGQVVQAALSDEGPDVLEFGVSDNLWFSSLDGAEKADHRVIRVPRMSLREACDRFLPDVVMLDIEGAEKGVRFDMLNHRPREIVMEIHTPVFGGAETCKILQCLVDAGYRLMDVRSQSWWFSLRDSLPSE